MRRSKLDSDKKAYLQIDFTFAAAVFVIFFAVVSGIFTNFLNAQEDAITTSIIQDNAREICMQLISTPGYPVNWQNSISTASFVGLKDLEGNYSLNFSKVDAFSDTNYFTIYDTFNIEEFVHISIVGVESGITYMDFGSTTGLSSFSGTYTCYSVYNNEIVRMFVEVWK